MTSLFTSSSYLLPPSTLYACRFELDSIHIDLYKRFATCVETDMAIQWFMKHISGTSKVHCVWYQCAEVATVFGTHHHLSLSCRYLTLCNTKLLITILLVVM